MTIERFDFESRDIAQSNIEKIGKLFPGVITEEMDENGLLKKSIDFDKLRAELSDDVVEKGKERYEFTWPGKRKAMAEANKPIKKTLRPVVEDSKNWDNTENLYIEGDNLEVLKLLQESYLGKVKMIYIDPPYNTGNDFVYNDDFKENLEDYNEDNADYDDDGGKLIKNTESNGRFHSDWCSMIYPRLKLARNLLTDDGVIFISIDDSEQDNLKKICDEVFGSDNFINNISVKMSETKGVKNAHADKKFVKLKEYILAYAKDTTIFRMNVIKEKKSESELIKYTKYYNKVVENIDDNVNNWKISEYKGIDKINDAERLIYLVTPDNDVNINIEKGRFKKIINSKGNVNYYYNNDGVIKKVLFLYENMTNNKGDLWTDISTININKETDNLPTYSDGQKPIKLIKDLISTQAEDTLVLDFFSGSSTTAKAVMELNMENNANRKFILVQLEEDLDDNYKKATSTKTKQSIKKIIEYLDTVNKPHLITEFAKERIRKAGEGILEKYKDKGGIENLDTGFRVFRVDSTNMKDVYFTPDVYEQNFLLNLQSNIKEDRNDLDLLFACLLDWGLPIDRPYTVDSVGSSKIHIYNHGDLVACFSENLSENIIKRIANLKPLRAVFRDSSFGASEDKINVEEIFKVYSPETDIRVL